VIAAVAATTGLALLVPATVAQATNCITSVNVTKVDHQGFASGVSIDTYRVKVVWGSHSQTATLQRYLMPVGAKPTLLREPLGTLDTTRHQVTNQRPGALTAFNGDFFNYYSVGGGQTILPQGDEVTKNKVRRSHATVQNVIGVDTAGNPYGGALRTGGTLTWGSRSFPITSVNWQSIGVGVGIYTSLWHVSSYSRRPAGVVEWVVAKGAIVKVLTHGSTGGQVAPGTRVIAFPQAYADVASKAAVGSKISMHVVQFTDTGVKLAEAIGRGVTEVSAASPVASCATMPLGARPRTTLGWSAKGKWMALIAPGTGYDSTGLRIGGLGIPQMAAAAAKLGFTQAYAVDGGGSTTSLVHKDDRTWHRTDDTDSAWMRPIVNAVAFLK
jgi:hypothetical protein